MTGAAGTRVTAEPGILHTARQAREWADRDPHPDPPGCLPPRSIWRWWRPKT